MSGFRMDKGVSTALATIAIIVILILSMSWMAYITVLNAAQQARHAAAAETAALKAKELVRVYIWLDPARQAGGSYQNLTRISFVNMWSGETTINSLLIVWRDGRYEERPVSIRLGAGEDKTYLPSQLGLEGLDNYQAALARIKYVQAHTSLGNDFVSLWGRPDKPALYVTGTTRTDTYTVTRTSTTVTATTTYSTTITITTTRSIITSIYSAPFLQAGPQCDRTRFTAYSVAAPFNYYLYSYNTDGSIFDQESGYRTTSDAFLGTVFHPVWWNEFYQAYFTYHSWRVIIVDAKGNTLVWYENGYTAICGGGGGDGGGGGGGGTTTTVITTGSTGEPTTTTQPPTPTTYTFTVTETVTNFQYPPATTVTATQTNTKWVGVTVTSTTTHPVTMVVLTTQTHYGACTYQYYDDKYNENYPCRVEGLDNASLPQDRPQPGTADRPAQPIPVQSMLLLGLLSVANISSRRVFRRGWMPAISALMIALALYPQLTTPASAQAYYTTVTVTVTVTYTLPGGTYTTTSYVTVTSTYTWTDVVTVVSYTTITSTAFASVCVTTVYQTVHPCSCQAPLQCVVDCPDD